MSGQHHHHHPPRSQRGRPGAPAMLPGTPVHDAREAAVALVRRHVRDRRTRIGALLDLRTAEPIRGADGVGFVIPSLARAGTTSIPTSAGQVLVLAVTEAIVRREIRAALPGPPPADPHGGPAHGGPAHGGPAHGGPAHGGPAHGGPAHGGHSHAGPEPVEPAGPEPAEPAGHSHAGHSHAGHSHAPKSAS